MRGYRLLGWMGVIIGALVYILARQTSDIGVEPRPIAAPLALDIAVSVWLCSSIAVKLWMLGGEAVVRTVRPSLGRLRVEFSVYAMLAFFAAVALCSFLAMFACGMLLPPDPTPSLVKFPASLLIGFVAWLFGWGLIDCLAGISAARELIHLRTLMKE